MNILVNNGVNRGVFLNPSTLLFFLTLVLCSVQPGMGQVNLLANPRFEQIDRSGAPSGWSPVWSRDSGAASLEIDRSAGRAGGASLKIVSTGVQDWSVGQSQSIPVAAGDIYTLSGRLKCEHAETAQLSVHLSDAQGHTLDWMAGLVETRGAHDWLLLSRRIVIPKGCAAIQFRLTGIGPGICRLRDPALVKSGSIGRLRARWSDRNFHLENRFLEVRFDPARAVLKIYDRRTRRTWRQLSENSELIVKSARALSNRALEIELWDPALDFTYRAAVSLTADSPEAAVTVEGDGPLSAPVSFPPPFETERGSNLIVPMNEGILYPADDRSISPISLPSYQGHGGLSMPWVGIVDPGGGSGILMLLKTPDDARVDLSRRAGGNLFASPVWEPSRGRLRYARTIVYAAFDTGGYVAQAKWYRAYAKRAGLFRTLAEKKRANPYVDLLLGAADVWSWADGKAALCREMKSLGMDHVLWSSGGSPEEIAQINTLGYLTGKYDQYQDVYPDGAPEGLLRARWPDDLAWQPDGDWMRAWAITKTQPDGTGKVLWQAGVFNSMRALARAREVIPADIKTTPYRCRFLDTTTASPWREDYNPAHPLSRSDDRRYKMALLQFCSDRMKLVTGSETGIDPSAPYVDYYEGMMSLAPYRVPDSGRHMEEIVAPTPDILKFQVGYKYRIPLWELVYHDCTVSYWYWGDYNNKIPEVWPQRDLWNILYGTPPMFMFDSASWEKNKDHIVASCKAICPSARRLACMEMISHEFLSSDHSLQRTRWKSGTEIIVNFSAGPQTLPGGEVVAGMSWTERAASLAPAILSRRR